MSNLHHALLAIAERYRTPQASSWTDLTLATNWSRYDSTFNPPQYRIRPDGNVELRGMLKKAIAVVAAEVVATLPAGFRPEFRELQVTISNGAIARWDIASNGQIIVGMAASNAWITLDGVNFKAYA